MSELEISKQDIKGAIQSKGVTPSGGLSSYAEAILSIPTSSVMGSLEETITENGEYTFNPIDNGVEGYNKVDITVDIEVPEYNSQSKTVEIKKNGSQTVIPDEGYDGLSSVEIEVNVASSGGGKTQIPNGFRFTGGDMAAVDFSQYDWSMVYDTSNFFKGCTHSTGDWSNFEQNFNGEVLSLDYMFGIMGDNYAASVYDGVPSLPNLGNLTSDALSAAYMCYNNKNLTDISNLKYWDTSNIIDTSYMFAAYSGNKNAPQVTSIDLTGFGHPNGYKTSYMFKYSPVTEVKGINSITAERMFEDSEITNIEGLNLAGSTSYMFSNCDSLTNLPPIDCSKITTMNNMFSNCKKLNSITLSNTSHIKNIANICSRCDSLTTLPMTDFSSVTDASYAFYMSGLASIPSLISLPLCTYTDYMFQDCKKLYTSVGDLDLPKVTSAAYMFGGSLMNRVGLLNTPSCANFNYLFSACTKLYKVAQLDISSATNLSRLFSTCSKVVEARFKGDPSKITSYTSWFNSVSTQGRIYYDGRYDYSKLLSNKPSKWDAVSIPFGEDISTRVRILRENKWFSGEPIKIGNVDAEYKGEGWYEATVPSVEDMKDLKITHNGECLGYSAPGDYYELDVDTYPYEKQHIGQDLANFVVDWGDWYLDGDVLKTDQAGSTMIIEVPGIASFEFDHYSNNTSKYLIIEAGNYNTYGSSKYTIYDENDNKLQDINVTSALSGTGYSTSQYKKFKITSGAKASIGYIKCGVFPHFPTN